jgi:ORF6N domain-containing protein
LAELYGVSVKRLNEQVKRNARRFPADFRFRLNLAEHENLRSQFATSSFGHGGRRSRAYAFTEHGAVMAASVLNSQRAIQMSIFVVRAFVRLRGILVAQKDVVSKLGELERRLEYHDRDIRGLVAAIRQLMAAPAPHRRRIGFDLPQPGSGNGRTGSGVRAYRGVSTGT